MDSSPLCVSFCPISCHKSIGGRSSSRWRAGRATSSRRRGTGFPQRVAAACRRSGRNAGRAGSGVACFVILAHLARQSLFSLCSTQECCWLLAAVTSSEEGNCRMSCCARCSTRCGVMFLSSHDLSQVHRKGDLGDEVDGMQRKRRRRLQRVPDAFERCRCS